MNRTGPITRLIIWLNALVAAYSVLAGLLHWPDYPQECLRLQAGEFFHGQWWEPFTCMWVHAPFAGFGVLHILFNMMTLAAFGSAVERALGTGRYLFLYLAAGLISSFSFLLEAGVRWWFWGQENMLGLSVVGASGAIFGVVAAFALLYPDVKLYVMLIPVPIRAIKVLWGAIVLSILFMLTSTLDLVAHSAHLGGALAGLACMKWIFRRGPVPVVTYGAEEGLPPDPEIAAEVSTLTEEDLRRELPLILEKISTQGLLSLTARERRILERGRVLFR